MVDFVLRHSGLERGEISKDILPFPLSAFPSAVGGTVHSVHMSLCVGRAQKQAHASEQKMSVLSFLLNNCVISFFGVHSSLPAKLHTPRQTLCFLPPVCPRLCLNTARSKQLTSILSSRLFQVAQTVLPLAVRLPFLHQKLPFLLEAKAISSISAVRRFSTFIPLSLSRGEK